MDHPFLNLMGEGVHLDINRQNRWETYRAVACLE